MNKRWLTFFTLMMLLLFAIHSIGFAQQFEKEKGPDGESSFTILTLPDSALIYVMLSVKTGTVRDPKGKEGLNYITANLIDAEISKKLNEKASSSAASFYSQIDKERTTFFFKVHRDRFEKTYPLFISGFIHPDINKASCDLVLARVKDTLEGMVRHSESLSLIALELFIYRNHPYGTPDFGTAQSLRNISPSDAQSFFRTFYTAGNIEAGVAGAQAEKILKRVKKDLHALPKGKPEEILIEAPVQPKGNKVLLVKNSSTTAAVSLGFPVDFTRADDDYYPLMVVNARFGQHRYLSGYLFRQLRVIRGFNYGDYSYLEKFSEGYQDKMPAVRLPRTEQYFSIWIRNLENENACFAAKFAFLALQKIGDKGLSGEDFSIGRDFVTGNSRLWAFDPFQMLGFSMDSDFYHTPYFISWISEKMKKLSPVDVTSALQRRISHKCARFVIVTNDPESMKKRLLGAQDCAPLYRTELSASDKKVDEEVCGFDLSLTPEDIEVIEAEKIF